MYIRYMLCMYMPNKVVCLVKFPLRAITYKLLKM